MKIVYNDIETKKNVHLWIRSCTDPFVKMELSENIAIYPNSFLINKNKVFERILNETNCFDENIILTIKLNNKISRNNGILDQNSDKIEFRTNEGEEGLIRLHRAGFDSYPSITIVQNEIERTFYYTYNKNPAKYNGNLLKEYEKEQNIVTKK